MNLYNRIKNADYEIPEEYDLKIGQAEELLHNVDIHDRFDLVCIAFKFGYMQGCRAEQDRKYAMHGKKELIHRMIEDIADDSRIDRIFNMVHRNFIRDKEQNII